MNDHRRDRLRERLGPIFETEGASIISLLKDLISFSSLPGEETPALDFLSSEFKKLDVQVEKIPISGHIKDDPDYSRIEKELDYSGRFNLLVRRKGKDPSGGRSIILQSHIDVVEAKGWKGAFRPKVDQGVVHGRGACDAKGQVVTLYLVLAALDMLGLMLKGDLDVQIVIEEEVGGNGALALILDGYRADGVIVLEGTNLQVHPANRGALWFKIGIQGKPVHMGRKQEGVSAIEKAVKVIGALSDYEVRLLKESQGFRLFERYQYPVQLNIGVIRGGEWPSTVPEKVIMKGGVGFLPNRTMDEIKDDLKRVFEGIEDDWIRNHHTLSFETLHNDAYEIPADHPLVTCLHQACLKAGIESEVFGWNVSCDARLYAKRGGMPTVVFGPGDIACAHSSQERIEVKEILNAAEALVLFLIDWCGT
ncbi:MAG TPA: ArgE/DapE family deacylase [Candidatus Latescibacteria bacterium]|nr:ArgE/DapE family deacylase [Candidatus Latescibacterota bacterium]